MSVLFVVSAPSGAGKTTLCRRLIEKTPRLFYSISFTTRPPREGEEDGRDYHFVSLEKFKEMIARDEFLEWAEVYGRYYGTGRKMVKNELDQGNNVLVDVDTLGARQIKDSFPEAVLIFIVPPTMEELGHRLFGRGSDSEAQLKMRIGQVREEIKAREIYDYLIINDDIEQALNDLKAILRAEQIKMSQQEDFWPGFFEEQDRGHHE